MLDYDREAEEYDATRGGEPRAVVAADAVLGLLPEGVSRLLDVACGTGIVTRRLPAGRPGLRVTGADLAHAMTRFAAARLPGAVVRADSRRLPFPDGTFDAVTSVWLLHLVDGPEDVRAVVAECARVLRPGGMYLTTVDKADAHDVGSDIDAVLAPRPSHPALDAMEAVTGYAAAYDLVPAGRTHFPGVGQGRSPRSAAADLRRGWFATLTPGSSLADQIIAGLESLPEQDRQRPDPMFTLQAFRKS